MAKKKKKKNRVPTQKLGVSSLAPIQVNRVERVIQVDDIEGLDMKYLAELYRLEGMRLGFQLAQAIPMSLNDQVSMRQIPPRIETRSLCRMIAGAIEKAGIKTEDQIAAKSADLEKAIGYIPEDLNTPKPDELIRVIELPDAKDGKTQGVRLRLGGREVGGDSLASALRKLADSMDEIAQTNQDSHPSQ